MSIDPEGKSCGHICVRGVVRNPPASRLPSRSSNANTCTGADADAAAADAADDDGILTVLTLAPHGLAAGLCQGARA